MVYDADQAGEMATLRGLDLLLEEGMSVKVATLDKGHDPDSFIRKFGPRGFHEAIKKAKSLFRYKLDLLTERFDKEDADAKAEIVKEMLLTIHKVRNSVVKAEYIKNLSQELAVREDAVWDELKRMKKGVTKGQGTRDKGQGTRKDVKIPPAEKILVKLMIEDSNVVDAVKDNLHPFDFKNTDIRHLVETLFTLNTDGNSIDVTRLINFLEDKVSPHVISFIVNEDIEIRDKERNVADCIKTIKREQKEERLKDIQNRLVVAQKKGYEDEARDLLKEFNRLIKGGI